MTVAPVPLEHAWLLPLVIPLCGFIVGIWLVAILAAAGAAASTGSYAISQKRQGRPIDANTLVKTAAFGDADPKKAGIKAGIGIAGAFVGPAISAATTAASSATASAASNVAAAGAGPISAAPAAGAISAPTAIAAQPGALGATGTAVDLGGAVAPSGAAGGIASLPETFTASEILANAGVGAGPGSTSNQIATQIARHAPQRAEIASLTNQGQALANVGDEIAAVGNGAGFRGPSYPQFQQATGLVRGDGLAGYDPAFYANYARGAQTAPTFAQRAAGVLGRAAIKGGANAATTRDPRRAGLAALAGAVGPITGSALTDTLSDQLGEAGGRVAGEVGGGLAAGAVHGLGSEDPGRGALSGALSSGVGAGVSSFANNVIPDPFADRYSSSQINQIARENERTLFRDQYEANAGQDYALPSTPAAQMATGMHMSDMHRGYGISTMDAVRGIGTREASGRAGSAVGEILARRPPIAPPPLATSGPALYQGLYAQTRPQASLMGPNLYRQLRRV